jgi:hypothetical protein
MVKSFIVESINVSENLMKNITLIETVFRKIQTEENTIQIVLSYFKGKKVFLYDL